MKFKTDTNFFEIFLKKGPVRWALLILAVILSVVLKYYFMVPLNSHNPRFLELKDEWTTCQKDEDCVAIYNGCEDVAVNKKSALTAHDAFINWHNVKKINCDVNTSAVMNVSCQNLKCVGTSKIK